MAVSTWTSYSLAKGPKFALQRRKQHTDLTFEMLQRWAVPCSKSHLGLRGSTSIGVRPEAEGLS